MLDLTEGGMMKNILCINKQNAVTNLVLTMLHLSRNDSTVLCNALRVILAHCVIAPLLCEPAICFWNFLLIERSSVR